LVSVGGAPPPVKKNRRRRGVGDHKVFSKIPEKISFYQNFSDDLLLVVENISKIATK